MQLLILLLNVLELQFTNIWTLNACGEAKVLCFVLLMKVAKLWPLGIGAALTNMSCIMNFEFVRRVNSLLLHVVTFSS